MKKYLSVLLFAAGCAVHAQPISSLPLCTCQKLTPDQRTGKRILIAPFEDLRGPEYSRASADHFIPVANLFHSALSVYYPDQSGMLRSHDHHGKTVTVGALGAAMPALLGNVMRQMQFTDLAVAGDVLTTAPEEFDYVVVGRLKKTRFREDNSPLTHALVGLLGVPYQFASYDLEYEITLFDTHDRYVPLFQRSYVYKDKRAAGVYYNHDWAYPMFVRGLEQTLPSVVADLASVVAQRTAAARLQPRHETATADAIAAPAPLDDRGPQR